ncbi:conjugal transfer protein TraG N-terminal domain-containing protein [Syntrophorhabdus aromaticivorans]|uniref:conjugal transfer protein TraG N-terminal domain-containing protein n=1 Tax=Syntrophorhabdus aromaticivorans TaxID=328301 RepID=UPI000408188B|nr:conjugal transfer protein TraG N-terminal domain-containing protein [Syntrophorhabdus aromaticivorans]
MRKKAIPLLAGLGPALFSTKAFALDMEYYTYNGFDAIVPAFQKIALIFGDSGYSALLFCVLVAAFLFGVLAMLIRGVGGRFSPAAWAAPVAIGFVIYAAMIVPKGTLHIYDPVKNRDQAVGGIPDGVVMVAGILNRIERAFVDMIYTAVTPDSYQVQAGGIGFDMLYGLGSKGIMLSDKNVQASLRKYTEDCVMFEIQRPGTTLTINSFASNTDFAALFSQAASPAIYTTYYDSSGDSTMTCAQSWTNIQARLSDSSTFDESLRARCAEAGFDPTIPVELTQCQDTLADTVDWLQGATYSAIDVHRQMLFGQTMNDVLTQASPDVAMAVLASRNTGSALVGTGVTANQWIPAVRAVITAVTIGLIPFLVIFIPTPLMSKAVLTMCGFFIWLTAWGVTDAIVHSFGMDFAKKALYEVTQNQLGLTSLLNFSTEGLKALAVFGAIRWSGIMLATVITGMLVRVGGSVLGRLSAQVIATPMGQGQTAGGTVATPEGLSREMNALEVAPATMANAHKFSYTDRANASSAERMGKTGYGVAGMDTFGGVEGFSEMIAAGAMGRTIRFGNEGQAMRDSDGGYKGASDLYNFKSTAGLREMGLTRDQYENDPAALAQRKVAAEGAFISMAKEKGMTPAELQRSMTTMDLASTADFVDKYATNRGTGFIQGARELGELSGSQRYVGARSFENARSVVGEDGLIFTDTNKHLNEAAKFEMSYQLAHSLGMAKDRSDFQGMYALHKQHHGEDSLTLSDSGAVRLLNTRMRDMGYSTRFKAGDRIKLNFDDGGNVVSAFAVKGASREISDITSEMKGYQSNYLSVRRETTGFRGEHGTRDITYGEHTYVGARQLSLPGGEKVVAYGTFQYDGKGKLVAGDFKYGQQGSGVSIRSYNAGKVDDAGNPIVDKQVTFTEHKLDSRGIFSVESSNSVTVRQYNKNGYSTTDYINPATNQVLFSKSDQGQTVTDHDTYLRDHRKSAEVNSGAIIVGKDLTTLTDGQQLFLSGMGGLDWASETVSRSLGLLGGAKNLGLSKKPGSPMPNVPSAGPMPHKNPNINHEAWEYLINGE